MRKIYKHLLMVMVIWSISAKAQVSIYAFSQYTGTYTAITGGTVVGSTTSDDQVFVDPTVLAGVGAGATGPGFPIGFNFVFDNIIFDRVGVNNNGWITLGQSSQNPAVNTNASSGYTGLSSTSTAPANLQYRIAGLSRDLQGQTGSSLRLETIGTAPNRTFVVQWTNYRKFAATGDNFDFQIRLLETSNAVEVVYGTFVNNATASTAQVGLRGASVADFNNRITDATNPWSASIPGTAVASAVNYNAALTPTMGQVYRWDPPPPCSGAVASNTVVGTLTLVCPGGTSNLMLANTYTPLGYIYQWVSSTVSPVGPFSGVTSATNTAFAAANLTVTTYYQAVITCTVSQQSFTTAAFTASIAGTTTNTVPYFEDFEGIVINNQLPNCSWKASNLPTINQTYTIANTFNRIPNSGNKFASFRRGTNVNGDYYYTNAIELNAGITYSASVGYITDGLLGWSEFSLLYGLAQSSVGLTTIASVTGAVTGTNYKWLGNTFTVPTSGMYFIAVKAKGNTNPEYLTFDDLSVTIPCSANTPTVTLNPSKTTLCSGEDFLIDAAGADTYTWSTGDTSATINPTAGVGGSNIYYVIGTNTLAGCANTASLSITVNPTPPLSVFANFPTVCAGQPVNISAFGADTYTWTTTSTAPFITVNPLVNTSYSVTGTNSYGCSKTAVQSISVQPLPTVSIIADADAVICAGEEINLTAFGAGKFQWTWATSVSQASLLTVQPMTTTSYTVVGTDAKGCSNTAVYTQNVDACQGLKNISSNLQGVQIFPNPTNGLIQITAGNNKVTHVEIIDISGRILHSSVPESTDLTVDLVQFPTGVYYVKIMTDITQQTFKIIKN